MLRPFLFHSFNESETFIVIFRVFYINALEFVLSLFHYLESYEESIAACIIPDLAHWRNDHGYRPIPFSGSGNILQWR